MNSRCKQSKPKLFLNVLNRYNFDMAVTSLIPSCFVCFNFQFKKRELET